jgi:hypothetical protein
MPIENREELFSCYVIPYCICYLVNILLKRFAFLQDIFFMGCNPFQALHGPSHGPRGLHKTCLQLALKWRLRLSLFERHCRHLLRKVMGCHQWFLDFYCPSLNFRRPSLVTNLQFQFLRDYFSVRH